MTFEEDHVSQRYRSHRALLPGSWSVEVKLRGREGMGHPWFAPRVNQKEPLPDPESWDAPPPPSSLLTQSALKAGRGLPPKLFGMEIS